MTARKVITRRTMVELIYAIYEAEGWMRAEYESRSHRVQELYTITADAPHDRFVATPKVSA